MISKKLKNSILEEAQRLIENGFGERTIRRWGDNPPRCDVVKFPVFINGVLDELVYSVKEKRFTHVEIQYIKRDAKGDVLTFEGDMEGAAYADEEDIEIVNIKL
jgi:hypothetical protein